MANNIQQQVNSLESKGLPALQQMQKLDPKMLVGVAIDNLEQGLKEDQRAKQVGGGNVGAPVIDKKLMGLGGLGLGQQEALSTAQPGLQQRGQQMQASQLAKAIQQAQKRPAGGIASMPMMRNQMRLANGGVVGFQGGGLPEIGRNVKGPIPQMSPEENLKLLEYLKDRKKLAYYTKNPEQVSEQGRKALELDREIFNEKYPASYMEKIENMMRGPANMGMAMGGEVQKFNPGGDVIGYDGKGNPLTQEQFDALMLAQQAARDTTIKIGDETMVDSSRLPNSLTPAEESERDLAKIHYARARKAFENTPTTDDYDLTAEQVRGMNKSIVDSTRARGTADFFKGILDAPRAIQQAFADTPMGEQLIRENTERGITNQNEKENLEIKRRQAEELAGLEANLTDEQRLKRFFSNDPKFVPAKNMDKQEQTTGGIQPEKTPLGDKIFSLLETLGDFSGAPKGYEGATFLARKRIKDEQEADRAAQADLLDRELAGRLELMQAEENMRAKAASGLALAEYSAEYLNDSALVMSQEYQAKKKELLEKAGGGIFNILYDSEEEDIEKQMLEFLPILRSQKEQEYRGLLNSFRGDSGTTAQTDPVFEFSGYNPNAGQ